MKKRSKNKKSKYEEYLLEDDVFTLHRSKGNGTLRRLIWINGKGKVTRYSLAYINHNLFRGDNGRVLGYDNAHGYHHKHYMGTVEAVVFNGFAEIEEQFRQEFEVLHEKAKKK